MPDLKPAFLEALRQVPVVRHACEAIGVTRQAAYAWRKADAEFAAAWDAAITEGDDGLEREAIRRAREGFEEPVFHKGQLVYRTERYVDADGKDHVRVVLDDRGQPVPMTVRRYSDRLLEVVLKGRRRYTDRTELTGADGKELQPMDETARAARVAQLLAAAQGRRDAAEAFGDLV